MGVLAVMAGVGIYYGKTQKIEKRGREERRIVLRPPAGEIRFANGAINPRGNKDEVVRQGIILGLRFPIEEKEVEKENGKLVLEGRYEGESVKVVADFFQPVYLYDGLGEGRYKFVRDVLSVEGEEFVPGERYDLFVEYVPEDSELSYEGFLDFCRKGVMKWVARECTWAEERGFGKEKVDFEEYVRQELEENQELRIEGKILVPQKVVIEDE